MFINKIQPANYNFKQSFQNNDVKVSVILPIYNQEKYLAKALNSLRSQTLKETEFICVNDGSIDKSLEILNQYAKKDSRIKIINQKNQGSGGARNNGLKIAQGEYIAFLDPDDWLEPQALEDLYKKSKKQNCDMVVFNYNVLDENNNLLKKYNLKERLKKLYQFDENKNFTWRDIKPRVLGGIYPASWNKFYKADLIKNNKIKFANCSLAEDNVFVFGATLNAKNIGYSGECYYNYLVHDQSAIRSCSDKNLSFFKSIDAVKKLLEKMKLMEELKTEYDGYILRFVSYHIKQIKSVEKFKEICKKKLSPYHNELLKERFAANKKIPDIITSLLKSKMK